ncbi:hypothetical protein RB3526 [Rhodopirellula baltica SH 1]|uniref:Uncharacterized protein n=1 Tax=Rhodopirellula baltica (strain DSM 10527 / NCIMB 13988 / SH1) TaxID=243090 RepID=Q7UU39_RHOBA|nr:hypothetical protein RB3526 [Rhodopirellula baltica SH 1]
MIRNAIVPADSNCLLQKVFRSSVGHKKQRGNKNRRRFPRLVPSAEVRTASS